MANRELAADARLVYALVKQIPPGKISTYACVAAALGSPNLARRVGKVLSQNPFAPNVPCHRVVMSNFNLGGYMGNCCGSAKADLLLAEGILLDEAKKKIAGGHLRGGPYRRSVVFDDFRAPREEELGDEALARE